MLPKESCCKDIDFNIKRGREPRKGLPLLVTYLRPTQTLIVGVVVPDEVSLKEVFDELASNHSTVAGFYVLITEEGRAE